MLPHVDFRYTPHGQSDASTNCYLSDWLPQDINPAEMPDMDGAELFERGSFGRGCELYVVPFFNMGQFKQPGQEEQNTRKTLFTLDYSRYRAFRDSIRIRSSNIDKSACSLLLRTYQAVQTDALRRAHDSVCRFRAGLSTEMFQDERNRSRSMHVLQLQVSGLSSVSSKDLI